MVKKRQRKAKLSPPSAIAEDTRAEILTVAWMLSAMATLGAEVVGGILRIVLIAVETAPSSLLAFPRFLLFTATITGIVCLCLTPLVYRYRHAPPPTAVAVLAVTVSVLPLTIGIVLSLR
ncbi:MAG: hypothetical protein H6822_32445 [Planctomycetaceae bacterium]|nr:hypothetical protein [Planctomycetales bacterium]MCB9926896.1 hypothetical protein [Planctomycetaceae bacterium]